MTSRQLRPFQKPERPVPVAELAGPTWPAATQLAADRQLTPLNRLALPRAGAGTFVTVHVLPFQDTAAALPVLPPAFALMSR